MTSTVCPLPSAADIIETYLTRLHPAGMELTQHTFGDVDVDGQVIQGCVLTVLALMTDAAPKVVSSEQRDNDDGDYSQYWIDDGNVIDLVQSVYGVNHSFSQGVINGFDNSGSDDEFYPDDDDDDDARGYRLGRDVRLWLTEGIQP